MDIYYKKVPLKAPIYSLILFDYPLKKIIRLKEQTVEGIFEKDDK